jgi:hypothetical protein
MELASRHHSGIKNFEMAAGFLENLYILFFLLSVLGPGVA